MPPIKATLKAYDRPQTDSRSRNRSPLAKSPKCQDPGTQLRSYFCRGRRLHHAPKSVYRCLDRPNSRKNGKGKHLICDRGRLNRLFLGSLRTILIVIHSLKRRQPTCFTQRWTVTATVVLKARSSLGPTTKQRAMIQAKLVFPGTKRNASSKPEPGAFTKTGLHHQCVNYNRTSLPICCVRMYQLAGSQQMAQEGYRKQNTG